MAGCCDDNCSLDGQHARQRKTLIAVFIINAIMFVVIVTAALIADSSAMLSDSLDNLGDAITYLLSLYVVTRGVRLKAKVALFKGLLILLGACVVAGQIIYKLFNPVVPVFELMGIFSLLALFANLSCLLLLNRHRHEDINMSSVWECSRNDILTNISVFIAAAGVWLTGSGWPDMLVAFALVILLFRSALRVISQARTELKAA